MNHIVYRTENKVTGSYYYGVHNGNIDKYLGSGLKLKDNIKKYGVNNCIRRTVMECDKKEDAYSFEQIIVDSLLLKDPKCLNLSLGGKGGLHGEKHSKAISMSNTKRKKGIKLSEEHKSKIKKSSKIGDKLEIVKCPKCGRSGAGGVMNRWHFDNCKNRTYRKSRQQ